ncbi:hypothetical protein [Glycomyces xiaoerkulensis]|uniref:hypothetical protein n=1 Tax=Glycomyces xiaoerkulensis TaxID=2038139 RepID=UPI0012FFDD9E|nr:hypothetical protein [Glycomyces xiaoerkulensis]
MSRKQKPNRKPPTKEAPKRLARLGLDDQTQIWRLRTNGPGRLYGYRVGCVFHLVFWDPRHEIWPSQR